MKKKSIAVFLVLSLSMIFAHGVTIKDGSWNSKPWDKEKLESGVEISDPDALAEWAYCSVSCKNGVRHEPAKIFEYSKKASKAGSALGTSMLAQCYYSGLGVTKDVAKSGVIFKQASDQGHPFGTWRHHVNQRLAGEEKFESAIAKMEKCIENGLIEAHWSIASIYHYGGLGVVDMKKAGEHYVLGLHKAKSLEVAIKVVNFHPNDAVIKFIPQRSLDLARQIIDDAASNGHIYSKFNRAFKLLAANEGFHQYVPDLVAISKLPYNDRQIFNEPSAARIYLKKFADTDRYRDRETGTPYLVINNMSRSAMMLKSYDEGSRLHTVHFSVVNNLLKLNWWQINQRPTIKEEDRAVNILRNMFIEFPDVHTPHHTFGDYFSDKIRKNKNGSRKDFDRGMAHHMYHSFCNYSMFKVAENYCKYNKTKDLVKGAAAAKAVIRRGDRDYTKKAEAWLAKAQKAMNDKQKSKFQALVSEGFPSSRKFRMNAFKKLQEIGDLPKEARFDNEEEEDGDEEEEAFYKRERNSSVLVMYKPDLEKSLYTLEEREVFEAYLTSNDITEDKMKILVSLLIEDDEKLSDLLDSFNGGNSSKRATQLKAIMGKEYKLKGKDSPIPAELGWYVTYEKEKLQSAPLITRLYVQKRKGTVRVSDVLMNCYGVSLARPNSRNLFMRLVHFWPTKTPLKLKVRRSPSSQHPGWQGQKNNYTNAVMFVQ